MHINKAKLDNFQLLDIGVQHPPIRDKHFWRQFQMAAKFTNFGGTLLAAGVFIGLCVLRVREEGTFGCKINKFPKFYKTVSLFICSTTLGTFFEF